MLWHSSANDSALKDFSKWRERYLPAHAASAEITVLHLIDVGSVEMADMLTVVLVERQLHIVFTIALCTQAGCECTA